jgi:hypothetical protein
MSTTTSDRPDVAQCSPSMPTRARMGSQRTQRDAPAGRRKRGPRGGAKNRGDTCSPVCRPEPAPSPQIAAAERRQGLRQGYE